MSNRKPTPGAKPTRKSQAKAEPKIHAPKVYDSPLHYASEELVGFMPAELEMAAEVINEKGLSGLVMGPPTMISANLVCDLFDRCLWIVAPADVDAEKVWTLRITPGPVFNSPDACEVFRWTQHTTSGAAYHQGLGLFAAALMEVARQAQDVRGAFNRIKSKWTEKAITNLHRSIW